MASALPALGSLAVGLVGSKQQSSAAKSAANATKPTPYAVSGPAGNVGVSGNQITMSPADNPFAPMFNMLGASSLANAATAPGSFLYGADPEIAAAYEGLFGQGLTDEIQGQYDLLSDIARPGEQRAFQALEDQLFARGQMGTSGGGERYRGFYEAQRDADLKRQLAATDLGRTRALDRFTGATGAVQQGMAGQNQQFNIGSGAFGGLQQLLQNLFTQANVGVGAGGGIAPSAAQGVATAAGVPWQQANQFLQTSGAFDALGRIFKGGTPPINPVQETPVWV